MLNDIAWIYRRILPFIWGLPLLAAVPFAAELLQHVVEAVLGLHKSGVLTPGGRTVRLAFGLVKIAGIVAIVIVALRWWHCEGNARRALHPSPILAAGILLFLALAFAESSLADVFVAIVGHFLDLRSTPQGLRLAIEFAPILAWTFISGYWLAWNVGLLIEDRTMTFRRSVAAARDHLGMYFAFICAGVMPLVMAHYLLNFAALGRPDWIVWMLSIADAAIVVALVVAVSSSLYAVYDDARARTNDPDSVNTS